MLRSLRLLQGLRGLESRVCEFFIVQCRPWPGKKGLVIELLRDDRFRLNFHDCFNLRRWGVHWGN